MVVDAVVSGRQWMGTELPALGAQVHVLPGWLLRRLITGHYGDLAEPRICINGVTIDGDIDLSYCNWTGELDLSYCHIRGSLVMPHATLKGRIKLLGAIVGQVDVSYSTINGLFEFQEGWCYEGFYGLGMQVTGSLNLRGTTIWAPYDKPNRCAVEMYRSHLGDVFLTRVKLYGGLYANGAVIERNFRLQEAIIIARTNLGWETGVDNPDQAISLVGAVISSAIYLTYSDMSRPIWHVEGVVALTRATCVTLLVSPPTLSGLTFRLDYFKFERLLGMAADDWFEFLNRTSQVGSQPYVHLAAYAGIIGRSDLQRKSLIALQHRITRAFPKWSWERWRRNLWAWSIGYGYRPILALAWLLLCSLLCVIVIVVGGDFLVYRPGDASVGVRGSRSIVQALTISMDNVLPFAQLGVAQAWSAEPTNAIQAGWLTLFVLLKFAGWSMAAVGLASVTGIMRKPAN